MRINAFLVPVLAVFLMSGNSFAQQSAGADQAVEVMLDAIGGRQAWADLRNTINGSQQNRVGEPTVVYAVITMDFERPRFRIETDAEGLHLVRVIDGDNHWRLRRNGNIEDVPDDLLEEDLAWYAAHLYRTIHRVAARDPDLTVRTGDGGRIEILTSGKRILWLKTDAKGEPYAFGSYDDDVGSLTGPWDFVRSGIHHPSWVSNATGTWRAAVKTLVVNVPLHDHMFARPTADP